MIIINYKREVDDFWALAQIFSPGKDRRGAIAEVLIKKKHLREIGLMREGALLDLYGMCLYIGYSDVQSLRVGDTVTELEMEIDLSKKISGDPTVKGLDAKLINAALIATTNRGGIVSLEFKTKDGSLEFSRYEPERCCAHLF